LSQIVEKLGKTEIGLLFQKESLSPSLKTGQILPTFYLDGTTPVNNEQLKSLESGSEIFPSVAFKI